MPKIKGRIRCVIMHHERRCSLAQGKKFLTETWHGRPESVMTEIANSIITFALINMLVSTGKVPTDGWQIILLGTMDSVPPYTLVLRFILGLQKLCARDLRGRRGSEIDTAFGFTSGSGHGAITRAIMFVDGGQNDGLEQGEEIQMEEREIRSAGSGTQ